MDWLSSPLLWWPVLFVTAFALLFVAANWLAWWFVGSTLLAAFSMLASLPWWVKLFAWVVYLGPLLVLSLPALRRRLISDRVLRHFRQLLPEISEADWQAIDAGTVWWEAELFRGRPRWKRLLSLPVPALSESERSFLAGPVEALCAALCEGRSAETKEVWRQLCADGYFGLAIPAEYGGKGFSFLARNAVIMKIASRDIGTALTVLAPNSSGLAQLLLGAGTEAQKQAWLPKLARGEEIGCVALAGPESGADALSSPDTGVVCRADSDGCGEALGVRLSFEKRYVALAPRASVVAVSFRLLDPQHLLGDRDVLGPSLALVRADQPGLALGPRHDPMHFEFPFGTVSGRDVFVPLNELVGGIEQAGRAWPVLMNVLVESRLLTAPAIATGTAKLASRITGAYARVRYRFHSPIGNFEGIQAALARIAGHTYVMDAARAVTTAACDAGERPAILASIVKYNLTARVQRVLNDAMDVHGTAGICLGPRNLVGRCYGLPPLAASLDGTNLLARNVFTFGQGVLRCHPHLRAELVAASDLQHGSRPFDRAFAAHGRFLVANAVRSLFHGLTGGRFARIPLRSGKMRRYFCQVGRLSAAFGFVADVLVLMHRGDLRSRERLSARMADVVSELLLAAATLRRFHLTRDQDADRLLAEWALEDCLGRVGRSFAQLFANWPAHRGAAVVRRLIFPLGLRYPMPSDRLEQQLAAALMVPSSVRDRLTAGMYYSTSETDQLGRLERALVAVLEAEPLERKLAEGVRLELIPAGPLTQRLEEAVRARLLSDEEAEAVRQAEATRREALRVDAFG